MTEADTTAFVQALDIFGEKVNNRRLRQTTQMSQPGGREVAGQSPHGRARPQERNTTMNTMQPFNLINLSPIGHALPEQHLSLTAGGKVTMQDFHFVMRVNKASPSLR